MQISEKIHRQPYILQSKTVGFEESVENLTPVIWWLLNFLFIYKKWKNNQTRKREVKKESTYRHLEAVSWAVSIIEALNEICFSFSFTGWNISISHGTIFC